MGNLRRIFVIFLILSVFSVGIFVASEVSSAPKPVIAFIDFDLAGKQFTETKALMEEYQADAEYYNSLLKPIEDELMRLKNGGDDSSNTFQLKYNEYQLTKQKYLEQIEKKYQPKFTSINDRLLSMARDYARSNGIDILLTSKVAVYINTVYDVTSDFVVYANSQAQY